MSADLSADDCGIVSPNNVRLMLQGVLRAAQASGWTDDALEAATGLKARRIKAYRVEGKEPSLSAALSLMVVLGQSAVRPTMALIGYAARPLDEADAVQPMQVVADALSHLAVIGLAAADNRIDHTEERACTDAADAIIATVLPLSRAGRAE